MIAEAWTVKRVLQWTTSRFAQTDTSSPRLDAEVLLAHALSVERIRLYVDYDKPLSDDELKACRQLVRRRLAGEPVAYILGEKEFWSLSLSVDQRVLVPRPDSERLVELAIAAVTSSPLVERQELALVDVGTGSGAIAVAIGHEVERLRHADESQRAHPRPPIVTLVALDIDPRAAALARDNSARNDVGMGVVCSDLLAPLMAGCCDVITANLPYVAREQLDGLPREVRGWEPRLALDGGDDGLDIVRRLVPQAARRLRPGGALLLELDPAQRDAVVAMLDAAGFEQVQAYVDLSGTDRVVGGRLPIAQGEQLPE